VAPLELGLVADVEKEEWASDSFGRRRRWRSARAVVENDRRVPVVVRREGGSVEVGIGVGRGRCETGFLFELVGMQVQELDELLRADATEDLTGREAVLQLLDQLRDGQAGINNRFDSLVALGIVCLRECGCRAVGVIALRWLARRARWHGSGTKRIERLGKLRDAAVSESLRGRRSTPRIIGFAVVGIDFRL
jgi:hypothetical protein